MERLQKVIANYGYCSRRKAEELIKLGKVKVNGVVIKELGVKVDPNSNIEIDGVKIDKDKKVYFLLNKPRGYISAASDDKGRKAVIDLINTNVRIYPVGRLDYDTTGALILTNDGDFADYLMHPKNNVDKVYVAKLNNILTIEDLYKLKKGVIIDGFKTSPAKVKIKNVDKKQKTSLIQITIHEGRNHQVKKMFESLGYKVLKLKREKISFLSVNNLNSGEYRELSLNEVKKLQQKKL